MDLWNDSSDEDIPQVVQPRSGFVKVGTCHVIDEVEFQLNALGALYVNNHSVQLQDNSSVIKVGAKKFLIERRRDGIKVSPGEVQYNIDLTKMSNSSLPLTERFQLKGKCSTVQIEREYPECSNLAPLPHRDVPVSVILEFLSLNKLERHTVPLNCTGRAIYEYAASRLRWTRQDLKILSKCSIVPDDTYTPITDLICEGAILTVEKRLCQQNMNNNNQPDTVREAVFCVYVLEYAEDGKYGVYLTDLNLTDSQSVNRALVDLGYAEVVPGSNIKVQFEMEKTHDTDMLQDLDRDMGERHRELADSIHIIRVEEIEPKKCIRPNTLQFHNIFQSHMKMAADKNKPAATNNIPDQPMAGRGQADGYAA